MVYWAAVAGWVAVSLAAAVAVEAWEGVAQLEAMAASVAVPQSQPSAPAAVAEWVP